MSEPETSYSSMFLQSTVLLWWNHCGLIISIGWLVNTDARSIYQFASPRKIGHSRLQFKNRYAYCILQSKQQRGKPTLLLINDCHRLRVFRSQPLYGIATPSSTPFWTVPHRMALSMPLPMAELGTFGATTIILPVSCMVILWIHKLITI